MKLFFFKLKIFKKITNHFQNIINSPSHIVFSWQNLGRRWCANSRHLKPRNHLLFNGTNEYFTFLSLSPSKISLSLVHRLGTLCPALRPQMASRRPWDTHAQSFLPFSSRATTLSLFISQKISLLRFQSLQPHTFNVLACPQTFCSAHANSHSPPALSNPVEKKSSYARRMA